MSEPEVLFEARTPLGFFVRVTRARWELIATVKHPVMTGRESTVKAALEDPDEVRQSRTDHQVLVFYTRPRARDAGCAPSRSRPTIPRSW